MAEERSLSRATTDGRRSTLRSGSATSSSCSAIVRSLASPSLALHLLLTVCCFRRDPATHPKHFDLRLHFDQQLVTFCIPPKDGFSQAPRIGEGDDIKWGRLALEEQPRAVSMALLDEGRMGVTMCGDIGEYKVSGRAAPKGDGD